MSSTGFETAISVINRLQTNASDPMATEVGLSFVLYVGHVFTFKVTSNTIIVRNILDFTLSPFSEYYILSFG
jgi:hypothetical protein